MTSDDTPRSALAADEQVSRSRRTLEGVVGIPGTEGNRVTALHNGCEIFPAMLGAIRGAEHTIDFLTFVYWKGQIGTEVAEAPCRRAKVGVRVRVLLDAWGSRPIERHLVDDMIEAGVQLRWFRPLSRVRLGEVNHRTLRKVLVVDELVAFTGGVGISDLWRGDARNEHEWRDTHFGVEGPAVGGLRAAFLDNWAETDPTIFNVEFDRFPRQLNPGPKCYPVRTRRVGHGRERFGQCLSDPLAVDPTTTTCNDRLLHARRRSDEASLRCVSARGAGTDPPTRTLRRQTLRATCGRGEL